ncbi:PREDICTED: toll-like receptor 7 [Nicrophorus vespilloides]|uniref:Toll-like receptor 7 n=1 Tax=Nicrophorus vespilloides TaxID=110193 RepID=A0ABM1MCJ4_NICVS|nr:PREDICTED: toll-like receptor 7 [Nicrophorus vespilloides]
MWRFLVMGALALCSSVVARYDGPEQCSWLPDNNDTSVSRLVVSCKLRTLDGSSANLSTLPVEGTSRLRISCSDDLFFESALPTAAIQRLHDLQDLRVENCKVLTLEPNAFVGLTNMKKIAINTFNWRMGKSLEMSGSSFTGLKELQVLNLGDNNMRALPEGVFCPLVNLQTLNLTRNRIRNADRLGFGDGQSRMSICSSSDLQILDLSYNDLQSLSDTAGFSRLRRLQQLDLKYNNIGEISGETLTGLVSLRVLNLANNKIEMLPQGMFSGSRELRELHLQNNSLFSLAKGLFHRLEQLLVLDLSGNQLTSGHVDAGTFTGLIRLIVLNLSHNALTRIDGRTFKDIYFLQILNLRNNSIGFIEDNAFLSLYNLHTLNLAENRLNTIAPHLFNGLFVLSKLTLNNNLIVNIDSRAFHNCSALKELDLSSNELEEVPDAIQELTFLKTLDLGENQITNFKNGTFRNLNQLTGLRMIDNKIGNLTKGMFWDLPSLQVLNLAKNKVQGIERGTFDRNPQIEAIRLDENYLTDINGVFATLASLLWLNLSGNHLVWFDYAFIPINLKWLDIHSNFIEHLANYYKIQDDIHVKTLDASHNRISEISALSIPNSVELLFINNNFIKSVKANTFLDKSSLTRVDMYSNDLVNLDLNALRLAHVPENRTLPEIYLGGNPFHCDCTMEWLQRINSMNATRQYPKVMDLDNVMCRMTHSRGMTHMPLARAKSSDFLCRYETHCFALCHCCDFDACDCEMTCPNNCSCYHDQTWNTNVVDCSGQNAIEIPHRIPMDATEVYLDGNEFKELQNHVFIGRKNMRVLYVNGSAVESIQNRTFNGLNALEILHMEDNRIAKLKGYEFEHLAHLKELYLQNNVISYIGNQTLTPLRSLEILRLDGNKLIVYPVWQLSANAHLTEVTLGNNQWSCRCKFLQELTSWVADNAAKVIDSADIMCYNMDSKPPQRRELDFNSTACSDYYASIDSMLVSDYLPMAVITLCVLVLLIVVLVLFFVFRDTVRVWLYSRYGVRLCSFRAAKQFEDRDKLYDSFVCYSPKDEEMVVQSLATELESGFQLCLHYRDLPHAAYLQHAAPAVLEAAEASRRLIIVLTRNFLQTEWSRFELRQALHEALKGRVFKLIIIEQCPLPEAELDPELRPYLKTSHRIRLGEKRFWEKLKYAMPTVEPRGKINANYRKNINNYTMETRSVVVNGGATHGHVHGHGTHPYPEKFKAPAPPSPQLYPPPAYSVGSLGGHDGDEANYSSATTATPSPRPARRIAGPGVQMNQQEPRPLSDHIYSSIDSDYSTLERGGGGGGSGRRGPPWRPQPHMMMQSGGTAGQAYLV